MGPRLLSFFSHSIRGRLALLVAAVLLPAVVLVSWLIYQSYRNERRALERHLLGAAHATSLLVDGYIAQRQALLQGLATSGRLQRGDVSGFRAQAELVVRGPNEWIVLADAEGQQVMNTLLPPTAQLPRIAFRDEFRNAANRGLPYISNLTQGPASNRRLLFTAIPIFDGVNMRYTLNYAVTTDEFGALLADGGAAKNWLVSIVDREGSIAARTRKPDEFVGRKASEKMLQFITADTQGVVETTTLDGIQSITGFVRSPTSGWTVIVASPTADLLDSAQRLLWVAVGVSLMFGSMAAFVAWWAGRGVVDAVQTLVAGTQTVGRGQMLSEGDTGIAETDTVYRALQATSARLVARESELVRANRSLMATASELREKQERLNVARTAAATGTFVWHVAAGTIESDASLNALLAITGEAGLRSVDQFIALIHPEDRDRVRDHLQGCARADGDFASEFRVVRPDGVTRWLFTRGRSSTDATGVYMAAACVDVTERKAAETEIARARDAAVAAARAKDEFLAALSHELRTPLNPVLLISSDAAQNETFPAVAREAFATIAKNAALEARLIDDLLDLTRITQGKLLLEMRPVDVHAVLREAIATVKSEVDQKYQSLELKLEAREMTVRGDSTRLQQVFWNLLKNAIKFTPAHGHIAVTTRNVGREIEIEVVDSGMGMTPEEIARSFKSFSQGDHATNGNAHRFGGLGLGLAISRMLVELHSGGITARSEGRGQGSRFTVSLSLAREAVSGGSTPSDAIPAAANAQSGDGARILLVEDHEATRIAISRLLGRRGYKVEQAVNSAEALRLAAAGKFDLVLSDIGLPDADGYTLMKRLREAYGLRGVALTGYGMEDDIERGRAAGFEAHITKPVDVNKLSAVLLKFQKTGEFGRAADAV